ncbi:MAG: septal ring lytic transglycosylase RlpA family protein [Xanthobacteraceae bacterium]
MAGRRTLCLALSIRLATLCLGSLVLVSCSGGSWKESRYSRRVVQEGEPVPKGGGAYRVGQPYSVNGRTYFPAENSRYRAEGIASWYGRDFHGRLTANGEVYDMHSISAAHATMPIPSYARVTNTDNGRSIIVRVNDRGPYAQERVIDLSIGAATALDFYNRGLARVRVEYVGPAPLEGSDDEMLLATLREGSPAPAPSKVMIAAAKPFLSQPTTTSPASVQPERPSAAAGYKPASQPQGRGPDFPQSSADRTSTRGSMSAAPGLGVMSGRGLY